MLTDSEITQVSNRLTIASNRIRQLRRVQNDPPECRRRMEDAVKLMREAYQTIGAALKREGADGQA